jgi:hypothetical protein
LADALGIQVEDLISVDKSEPHRLAVRIVVVVVVVAALSLIERAMKVSCSRNGQELHS